MPDPQPITAAAKTAVEDLLNLPTPTAPEVDIDSYEISDEVANEPLASADIQTLAAAAQARMEAENLVFPAAADLIEQAIVGLLGGHLVFHGPPGTGKTRLAHILAAAFECELHTETGTPDWSTYDVVGGLRPARDQDGAETLRPWLGHVPRAALRCAQIVEENLSTGEAPQAHWLTIDELSRADIDKAIGPLYTALSATSAGDRHVNLWFEDAPERSRVTLPERFRLIGTMNDVDTAFVSQLSQGLQRRFEFVYVGVPVQSQTEEELDQVTRQAAKWYASLYDPSVEDVEGYADGFRNEPRIEAVISMLGQLVDFLRWDLAGPRWPVGSAQIADVLRRVAVRAYASPTDEDLTEALDKAIANRVMQQASALSGDQLALVDGHLATTPLVGSRAALAQVREPHLTPRQ